MKPILQTKTALVMVTMRRAGYRDGAKVLELIDDYGAFVRAHDGDQGFEAYAHWTRRYSYRTAYGRLSLFRKTFPQLGPKGTPAGLYGPLLDQLAAEIEGAGGE